MEKTIRKCSICTHEFKAVSGDICADCWPRFQDGSPEWQDFWKWFPWARILARGE